MKRDWELVRRILIAVEELESRRQQVDHHSFPGSSEEDVSYHIYIMKEAGLVKAVCSSELGGRRNCWANELTWEGHEFLDKIRSQTMWSQINKVAKEKGLTLSFEVIKAAATSVVGKLLL